MKIGHHQYLDRESGKVLTEKLYGDRAVRFLYSSLRESAPALFRAVTSARISNFLAFVNFNNFLSERISGRQELMNACGIDMTESLECPDRLDTLEKIFQRKIRYWECRPMPEEPGTVVSPADARVLLGSFCETSSLFVKGKFFNYEELLGRDKTDWLAAFWDGDFAVFRLTPDKYHYNHTPVAGRAVDFYEIQGEYHSCNPTAVISVVTPYSKNKRVVTVIDTDIPGGTGVGLVAMVEVAALMVGQIVQCYSKERYDAPVPTCRGLFMEKGMPKSLFRPGSSTDILIFQKDRMRFSEDLLCNLRCPNAESRFDVGFGQHLVETDVKVRSLIGRAVNILSSQNRNTINCHD
ncbi:MAG TPA: phosphatidylserine decarboxylase [Syntrophales bacterium]|nr:phosphatidylserine decarboxylase [Syntrophales bacterium]